MSRSAWDSPHMTSGLDGSSSNPSVLSRQTSAGISRSQDDATVSYYFQRPQSENDLQAYGGGKRWAIGDDMLVEQAKSVSDIEREFHNINLGSDFSTKKFWELDDGHVSDSKGALFSASSPWSPRQSTWSSPTTDNNVAQALQLSPGRSRHFQNVGLGADMVDYVLGDHLGKNLSGLRGIKHDFSHDPENDVKTPKKTSKTSSPFEPVDSKPGTDTQSDLLCNGEDSFSRVLRSESPLSKLARDEEQNQINQQKIVGSTPTKKTTSNSHGDAFAPMLTPVSTIDPLNVSQAYGLVGSMGGSLDQLSFPDYTSLSSAHTMDSPAANQFTGMTAPLDYSSTNNMVLRSNMNNLSASQNYPQQPPASLYSINNSMTPQQQQLVPQQPPTPGGQPTQMPFNMFNQSQQPFNLTQSPQQQQPQQQSQQPQMTGSVNMPIALPNLINNSNTNQQQQQPANMFPHQSTSFVINGQDPHAMGVPMGPIPYVHTPWGVYSASVISSHQPQMASQQPQMANQQLANQQRPPSGQRPVTPSQHHTNNQAADSNQQQLNPQQVQLPPNFIDINNGYPAILAFYDHNGQLVTMNNARGMAGTPIRLVSPAPIIFNHNPNNMQQQPQQGFNGNNPINYNNSNGGPPNMNGMAMNSMHMNMQTINPQMSLTSTANNVNYSQNIPNADFAMPQRQDSFTDPSEKFRVYPPMNMSSTPSGPLGLVQPPQPVTPPALAGTTGLGLGSGGRIYSTAPGAEGTYRNNMAPHNNTNNMAGNSMPPFNRVPKDALSIGRSRLLEEFRGNRVPNLQLKDISQHVVEFSQDQHGSRFIQQKLERASMIEKQLVFSEILSAAYSLMTDVFGNYVIQKFFEFGLTEQKQTLAQRLTGQVLPLALQMYGCRVIQKALESIPADMQINIVKELDGHVLKCVKDQNGNHVVQKCIECVEPSHLQFVIDAFRGQVYTLSTHPYGCRVIQRILEHCLPEQTAAILSELHDQTDRLVLDQYGNYVIQHVLEHGRMEEKSKIVSHVRGKVLQLSQHKFASNVVEKCVTHSSRAEKAILIEEVCSSTADGGQSALYIMMKDQYANYVIQKMLDISEPNQRKILVHKIRPHIATLRKYTYGKHIIAKLEKYLMKNGGGDLSASPLTLSM